MAVPDTHAQTGFKAIIQPTYPQQFRPARYIQWVEVLKNTGRLNSPGIGILDQFYSQSCISTQWADDLLTFPLLTDPKKMNSYSAVKGFVLIYKR
jgi:hypothetical protein